MTPTCTRPETGELLAAYELGLLDDAEAARFERHAQECEHCADELFASAPWVAAVRDDPSRWREAVRVAAAERRAEVPSLGDRLAAWWRRLAPVHVPALALLTLIALMWFEFEGPGPASVANLEPLPWVEMDLRAATGEAERHYREGMRDYGRGRYRAAATLLQRALSSDELEPFVADQARLHLGVSQLLTRDVHEALETLREAERSGLPVVADRARWYQVQCHLVLGHADPARELLLRMAEGSPGYAAQAAAQLEALAALR